MNGKRNRKWLAAFLLLLVVTLTGCGKQEDNLSLEEGNKTKVVLTTGFGENEIFRISDEVCDRTEVMVYLTNMQNQYEKIFGKQFWNKKIGDMTVEEKIKNVVLSRVAQIKTMNLLAKEQNISLTEPEEQNIKQAATAYYQSLNEKEQKLLDVTEEDIRNYYEEYALAGKVYDLIIEDTNPEISDDEARTVTVSQIVIRTVTTDSNGQQIPMTEDSKDRAYETMRTVRSLLSQGETFDTLASRYNEAGQISVSFGKGEMEQIYETKAFELGNGEISDIFETTYGYVMLRCDATFDLEQTQLNKEKILAKRKEEAFTQIYDDFTIRQIRNLDRERWEEIQFIHDEEVTTSSFFEIYDSYCSS